MSTSNETAVVGRPHKKAKTTQDLPSLEVFISNAFFNECFTGSDVALKIAFNKNFSRDLVEIEDGVSSTFKTALPNLLSLESTLSDFVLQSEKFVVAPSTTEGDKAGDVFQKAEVLGVQAGAVVQMTIASVYQIIFDEKKQERKIARIDAVFVVQGPKVAAEVALESFVGTLLFGTVIQDDDAIFEIIFQRDWSRKVTEHDNGTALNFTAFHKFVLQLRKEYSNRRLLSQESTVNLGDSMGRTGRVAHISHISAVKDGVEVIFDIASIVSVVFHENLKEVNGGHRQILMESFVFAPSS